VWINVVCSSLFYDVILSCFICFVLKTSPHCVQKFAKFTKELNYLKNRATRAAKRWNKASMINGCDCERLQDHFTAFRTEYQEHLGRAYDDYRIVIEEAIKTEPRSFYWVRWSKKKKRVDYPSVMIFEDRPASGSQGARDFFAEFIKRTSVDDSWIQVVSQARSCEWRADEPPFGLEVEIALLKLDSSKGPGPDGVPPLILKNCASRFALLLCMLFNRSLTTCIFPDKCKLSFVDPVTMTFRITVLLPLLQDLKGCLVDCQHGFVKGRSTVSNLLEYSFFVLKSIEDCCHASRGGLGSKGLCDRSKCPWDIPYKKIQKALKISPKSPFLTFFMGDWKGHYATKVSLPLWLVHSCQVDLIYTDFSKTFDRVRHCLLLDIIFSDIEPARCQWLRFWKIPVHKNGRLCFERNFGYDCFLGRGGLGSKGHCNIQKALS
jgi:hypothetical protein